MLGDLSAKYESNGNPGCISTGHSDPGGVSYGAYQLSSNAGSVQRFVRWLCHREEAMQQAWGEELGRYPVACEAFNAIWRGIARFHNAEFFEVQHAFIQEMYYEPACESLRSLDFYSECHSDVMQDVIWSRAVQYGVGNISDMFQEACTYMGYPNLSYINHWRFDWDLIIAIYTVCQMPEWNCSPLREALYERFDAERREALSRFTSELPFLKEDSV